MYPTEIPIPDSLPSRNRVLMERCKALGDEVYSDAMGLVILDGLEQNSSVFGQERIYAEDSPGRHIVRDTTAGVQYVWHDFDGAEIVMWESGAETADEGR